MSAPALTCAASDLRDITVSRSPVVASPPLAANSSSMNTSRCCKFGLQLPIHRCGSSATRRESPPRHAVRAGLFLRLLAQKGLPVVAVSVIVQRHRSTGGLAEVRAVVLILVGRDRVRRCPSLFGRLHLDVAVAVDTGTAGISLPMITFSFRPWSLSLRQLIAASVSTRVVSWNDAADSHESVASDAW